MAISLLPDWLHQICSMQSLKLPHSLLHLSCNITLWLCQQVSLYTSMSLKIVSACISKLQHSVASSFWVFFLLCCCRICFFSSSRKTILATFFPRLNPVLTQGYIRCLSSNHSFWSKAVDLRCKSRHIVCICADWLEAQVSPLAYSTSMCIKSLWWPNDYCWECMWGFHAP